MILNLTDLDITKEFYLAGVSDIPMLAHNGSQLEH